MLDLVLELGLFSVQSLVLIVGEIQSVYSLLKVSDSLVLFLNLLLQATVVLLNGVGDFSLLPGDVL